jgi:hypothetical protein
MDLTGDERHACAGRAADSATDAKTSRQIGTGEGSAARGPSERRHWPLAFSLLLLVP